MDNAGRDSMLAALEARIGALEALPTNRSEQAVLDAQATQAALNPKAQAAQDAAAAAEAQLAAAQKAAADALAAAEKAADAAKAVTQEG